MKNPIRKQTRELAVARLAIPARSPRDRRPLAQADPLRPVSCDAPGALRESLVCLTVRRPLQGRKLRRSRRAGRAK